MKANRQRPLDHKAEMARRRIRREADSQNGRGYVTFDKPVFRYDKATKQFVAKNPARCLLSTDRSKYMPHVGKQERKRYAVR